jgi:hypothetical protein
MIRDMGRRIATLIGDGGRSGRFSIEERNNLSGGQGSRGGGGGCDWSGETLEDHVLYSLQVEKVVRLVDILVLKVIQKRVGGGKSAINTHSSGHVVENVKFRNKEE